MKKNNFSYLPLLLFISSFLIHCTDPISVPPDIPVETLLSAPDTLNVENQDIIFEGQSKLTDGVPIKIISS